MRLLTIRVTQSLADAQAKSSTGLYSPITDHIVFMHFVSGIKWAKN